MHYNDIQSAMAALYQANENFNALMEEATAIQPIEE